MNAEDLLMKCKDSESMSIHVQHILSMPRHIMLQLLHTCADMSEEEYKKFATSYQQMYIEKYSSLPVYTLDPITYLEETLLNYAKNMGPIVLDDFPWSPNEQKVKLYGIFDPNTLTVGYSDKSYTIAIDGIKKLSTDPNFRFYMTCDESFALSSDKCRDIAGVYRMALNNLAISAHHWHVRFDPHMSKVLLEGTDSEEFYEYVKFLRGMYRIHPNILTTIAQYVVMRMTEKYRCGDWVDGVLIARVRNFYDLLDMKYYEDSGGVYFIGANKSRAFIAAKFGEKWKRVPKEHEVYKRMKYWNELA